MSTVNWENALGGDWSVGTNWERDWFPAPSDVAQITLPGVYGFSITSDVSVAVMFINATGATLTKSSAGSLNLNLNLYNGRRFSQRRRYYRGDSTVRRPACGRERRRTGRRFWRRTAKRLPRRRRVARDDDPNPDRKHVFQQDARRSPPPQAETLTLAGSAQLSGPANLTFGASGEAGTNTVQTGPSFQVVGVPPDDLDVRAGGLSFFGNSTKG